MFWRLSLDSSGFCLQRLLRSPVHPDTSVWAGGESVSLVVSRESVQSPRHLLLLQRHGAVHQKPWPADRHAQGKAWYFVNQMREGKFIRQILRVSKLQSRGLDLSRVRTCVVVAEERPRTALTQSFSKLFKDLGLHPRAVSTSFGCRVNLAICLQVSQTATLWFLVDSTSLHCRRLLLLLQTGRFWCFGGWCQPQLLLTSVGETANF